MAAFTSSCTKEYTCVCTNSDGEETSRITMTTKKSLAEETCNNSELSNESCELE